MLKISKQVLANDKVIIKISADSKKELTQAFWKFVNYGNVIKIRKGIDIEDLTGLTLLDVTETSGYFRANIPDLIQTLINIELFKVLRERPELDELPEQVTIAAKKRGLEVFNSLPEENILNPNEII